MRTQIFGALQTLKYRTQGRGVCTSASWAAGKHGDAGLRCAQPSEAVCHKVEELDLHLTKMSFRSAGRELNLRGGEAFKRLLRCWYTKGREAVERGWS